MQNDIKVSIYCTSYNQISYLEQALEGMLMQKTNFLFQIIVHDDASEDGSQEIIRRYAECYPEIVVPILQEENKFHEIGFEGIYNIMRPFFKGKYVAYCECDDFWIDPLKLQKQVDFMDSHPDYMLCGTNAFVYWDELVNPPYYFNTNPKCCTFSTHEVADKWQFATASIIHRIELRDQYPSWTKGNNYWDFIMVLVASTLGKIYYMPDVTCVYRRSYINIYSASNTYGNNILDMRKNHLQILESFDKWTSGSFHIDDIIKARKELIKYLNLRNRSRFLSYLIMPLFSYNIRKNSKYAH